MFPCQSVCRPTSFKTRSPVELEDFENTGPSFRQKTQMPSKRVKKNSEADWSWPKRFQTSPSPAFQKAPKAAETRMVEEVREPHCLSPEELDYYCALIYGVESLSEETFRKMDTTQRYVLFLCLFGM